MALSLKSVLGVALETTPGTLISAPTLYVPTKSMVKAIKQREYVMDERGDRNEEHDVIDTIRHGEWDIKGAFYPDTAGYFMASALGAPTMTQQASTTAYKAAYTLADTPPALSLYKSFDAKKYSCAYSVTEKLSWKLSGPDKFLEFDASGKSLWPAIYAGTFSPSFSTVRPFAGYAPTITLTGGATSDIDELEISFEQKIKLWNPANGSQDWIAAYYGGRKVSFNFTARFDSDTLYETYYRSNNVNDLLTFHVEGANIASSYNMTLDIQLPVTTYDSFEHDLGKENVLVKAKGRALAFGSGAGNNMIKVYTISTIQSYAV